MNRNLESPAGTVGNTHLARARHDADDTSNELALGRTSS